MFRDGQSGQRGGQRTTGLSLFSVLFKTVAAVGMKNGSHWTYHFQRSKNCKIWNGRSDIRRNSIVLCCHKIYLLLAPVCTIVCQSTQNTVGFFSILKFLVPQ
jgi:hypothetical protein